MGRWANLVRRGQKTRVLQPALPCTLCVTDSKRWSSLSLSLFIGKMRDIGQGPAEKRSCRGGGRV